ncbi:MAG: RNA polymerase sigma factor [Tepidisphaeraceae bacterium]
MNDDGDLVIRLATGDAAARAEIVRRHIDFVYSAALRQVRDAHLAEDVSQAVFLLLTRKASSFRRGTILRGWLFTATRYAASNALKMKARREYHEWRAAILRREESREHRELDQILLILDSAMSDLAERDRTAILLSYFSRQSFREIGAALGVSEEAARKRVERAVMRLRDLFRVRGVTVAAEALVAGFAMGSITAPGHLSASVVAACSAAKPAGVSALIAEGVSHMMTFAKIKLAAAACGAVILVGSAGAVVLTQAATTNQSPAGAKVTALGRLEGGVVVELAGVSELSSKDHQWWTPDGTPCAARQFYGFSNGAPAPNFGLVMHLTGTTRAGVQWVISPSEGGWTAKTDNDATGETVRLCFSVPRDQQFVDIKVIVAAGDWETISSHDDPRGNSFTGGEKCNVIFTGCTEENGKTLATVTCDIQGYQTRVVAIDAAGLPVEGEETSSGSVGKMRQSTVRFDLPVEQIHQIALQARPFDQYVDFKSVSLIAGQNKGFSVETSRP